MDDRAKAREYHEQERSKKERIADESFRSTEVTTDYEEWRAAPGRKDFEGVDTIPPERKKQRAESALGTAQDIGLVNDFVEPESSTGLPGKNNTGLWGSFQNATKELGVKSTLDEEDRQETLAHEVGHAVDFGEFSISAAGMKESGLDKGLSGSLDPMITSERVTDEVQGPLNEPNEPANELRGISRNFRGDFDEGEDDYRDSPEELFADFIGAAIVQPRNTKAQSDETRESMFEALEAGPEELEPTKEFVERELPDNFLPGL